MKVRFGVIADLHTEYIHDGASRFKRFLDACIAEKVDFCIQLGDFCPPGEKNAEQKREILSLLRELSFPFYHVVGNHDTDRNEKSDVLSYLSVSGAHTSFDMGGVHFVTVDACYYKEADGYYSYGNGNHLRASSSAEISVLPPSELEWLEYDLKKTGLPSVIFSHQSLIESRSGIRNPIDFRRVAENAPSGVLLSVCGHEHVDRLEHKNEIAYYCLNSASYYWAGSKYSHSTYGEEIESAYPELKKLFPYRDPLFAIIDIDDAEVRIRGGDSYIVGATPSELGFQKDGLCDEITASVINRQWEIN